jgi:hypothetical protein
MNDTQFDMAENTVLRMISEANLGTDATGHFRKHDDIAAELGETNDSLQPTIDKLLDQKLIRIVNDKFEQKHGHALEYMAYQITELGKSHLHQSNNPSSTVYSGIYGSNIAHNSSNVTQTISIKTVAPDVQEKIKEFDAAVKKKDGSAMKQAFGYIADKAVDVAIALATGALIR